MKFSAVKAVIKLSLENFVFKFKIIVKLPKINSSSPLGNFSIVTILENLY